MSEIDWTSVGWSLQKWCKGNCFKLLWDHRPCCSLVVIRTCISLYLVHFALRPVIIMYPTRVGRCTLTLRRTACRRSHLTASMRDERGADTQNDRRHRIYPARRSGSRPTTSCIRQIAAVAGRRFRCPRLLRGTGASSTIITPLFAIFSPDVRGRRTCRHADSHLRHFWRFADDGRKLTADLTLASYWETTHDCWIPPFLNGAGNTRRATADGYKAPDVDALRPWLHVKWNICKTFAKHLQKMF